MAASTESLAERCRRIELLVLDVDGVLTDGGIIYSDAGHEIKQFHVRDGSGLKLWHWLGKRAAILSGRSSNVVNVRAAELDVAPVVQGARDKLPAYRQIVKDCGLEPAQVCVVGDDIPDLPMLRNSGLAVAVADACADVQAIAHYITRAPGGRGAVREVIEWVLRAQGLWSRVQERYANEA
jgi:3-deoxy-D-manno-octulosonate 8-phosphate phosphatase (KDO 8-P phosphatase)